MVRQLGTLRKGEFGFSSLSEVKFLVEKGWVNIVVAFSLVVDRELLNDTHRWRQIHVRSRQWTCFSCFHAPKSFNKPFEFLLYETNRLHFSVCEYCNIDHR